MWRERIIETKRAKGISTHTMSERSVLRLSRETITRILNATTESPGIDTVLDVAQTVGLSPWELFADPDALIAYQGFLTLRTEFEAIKDERDTLIGEIVALRNEITNLEDKTRSLEAKNDLLTMKLEHKEEVIALQKEIIGQHK